MSLAARLELAERLSRLALAAAKTPLVRPAAASQAVWYFNANTGDDNNVGDSPAKPLKHYSAYLARVGLYRPVDRIVDFYFQTAMPESDPIILSGVATSTGQLRLHGVRSALLQSRLTGWTSPAGSEVNLLQDASVASFAPYVGKQVSITDGTGAGAHFYVAEALGPGVARVSRPIKRDPTIPYGGVVVVPAGNEHYTIWDTLPQLGCYVEAINGPFNKNPSIDLEYLKFPDGINNTASGAIVGFQSCSFFCEHPFTTIVGSTANFVSCLFSEGLEITDGQVACTGGLFLNATLVPGGFLFLDRQVVFQNCTATISDGARTDIEIHDSTGVGVFKSTGVLTISHGGTLRLNGTIVGSGNTGNIITIFAGARVLLTNPGVSFNITSTGNDISILGQTSLPAMDPATYTLTASRTLTFAHLTSSIAAGGFNYNVFDPTRPSTGIFSTQE